MQQRKNKALGLVSPFFPEISTFASLGPKVVAYPRLDTDVETEFFALTPLGGLSRHQARDLHRGSVRRRATFDAFATLYKPYANILGDSFRA